MGGLFVRPELLLDHFNVIYFYYRLDDLYVIDMQFISGYDKPTIVYIAEVSCLQ